MRLSAIILQGFKSFRENTRIQFDANPVVIVGPNGCGKSNVVDALRWVLGESSARQLRSGVLSDVISNGGTVARPPQWRWSSCVLITVMARPRRFC
jgi:Chromosome segregation ATPases